LPDDILVFDFDLPLFIIINSILFHEIVQTATFLPGELFLPPGDPALIGEDSLTPEFTIVFWIATFSLNRLSGSFLSNFSSSTGVY